jgi:formylglycine-generating enzyme required for sulfatase activity
MPEAPKQLKVFLCHSSHDKPIVRELYQKLGAEGWIDPWLDEKKLLPGQDWNMEIEKAVETSHIVLVFLTNNSVNKEGYIQRELRRVLDVALNMTEDTIFVIPLKLEECEMPRSLRTWQWLNYFPPEERVDAYDRLLASLKIRANKLGIATDGMRIPRKVEPVPTPRKVSPPVEMPLARSGSDLDLYIPPEYTDGIFMPPPAKVKTWTFGGIEFVKVSHGEFLMGSKNDNKLAFAREKPQHLLNIPYDFLIARFQVTNEQFKNFVKDTSYVTLAEKEGFGWTWKGKEWIKTTKANWKHPQGEHASIEGSSNHPVVQIAWIDALVYFEWLTKMLGKEVPNGLAFRAPTEAEWEKAARGRDGREYPWGDVFDKSKCNSFENGKNGTTPVGVFSPAGDSPFYASDMVGNVWEWTASLWGVRADLPDFQYPYNPNDGREAMRTGNNVYRILRGGSFHLKANKVRVSYAFKDYSNYRNTNLGFRVVLAPRLP